MEEPIEKVDYSFDPLEGAQIFYSDDRMNVEPAGEGCRPGISLRFVRDWLCGLTI